MSFFTPSGTKIPGSQLLQSLSVTQSVVMDTLTVNTVKSTSMTDGVATLQNGYLTGIRDPLILSGVATKNYVDSMLGSIIWKSPCRLATTLLNNLVI